MSKQFEIVMDDEHGDEQVEGGFFEEEAAISVAEEYEAEGTSVHVREQGTGTQSAPPELTGLTRDQLEGAIDEAGARGDIAKLELVQLEISRRFGKGNPEVNHEE